MSKDPWSDRWEKIRELDGGGQGTTFLVRSRSDLSLEAVLKVLKNRKSEQSRGRMAREVINLKLVEGAGGKVPKVLDGNTEDFQAKDSPLYFVMDFVQGKTLHDSITTNGPLGIDDAIDLALDICRTVQIGHMQEVLHRDLKPKNIIIRDTSGGAINAVIVDYGLSFNKDNDDDLTKTDEQFKNPFFALPETHALEGSRRDARSDLTAICGVLLYALTKREPRVLLDEQNRLPHRRPGAFLKDLFVSDPRVAHLDSLFSRAFVQDLNGRLQNVSELISRLEAIKGVISPNTLLDPIVFAAQASDEFRQKSRPAQLMQFRLIASQVAQTLQSNFGGFADKLRDFVAVLRHPQGLELEDIGSGETLLDSLHFTVAHKSDPENIRGLVFRFVANGPEVGIFSHRTSVKYQQPTQNQTIASEAKNRGMVLGPPKGFPPVAPVRQASPKIVAVGQWSAVYSYPGNETPDFSPIQNHLSNWVVIAIQELVDGCSA